MSDERDKRAQLIDRFVRLSGLQPTDDMMTLHWSPLREHAFWATMADETLRQMAWSARHPNDSACDCGAGLTLAPDGWSPDDEDEKRDFPEGP